MRKLLLASTATLGALLAVTGGAKAQPLPAKIPAAGTILVHLNGYLQFSLGTFGSTYNTVGSYKLNPVATIGDARIYPGFDAQTVSGIDYGAQVEIRTGYSDPAVGQNGKVTDDTTDGTTSSLDSLYVKRAYGYVGTPVYGYARFGQTDSAFTLLQDGVVEAFGDGGQWTLEGGVRDMLPSNASPGGSNQFIYADQTPVYATDKVVYETPSVLEPVLGGAFSGVVGFEPNSDGLKEGYNACSGGSSATASPSNCADLGSSPVAGDIGKRRQDTFDGMAQYALKINGAAIKVSAGLLHGSPVHYDGAATAAGTSTHFGYDTLNVYQAGGQVTYVGVTLGANIKGGQVEDGYAFKPKGARDALAYIIDANYVLGPYVIGASYFNSQSAGVYIPLNTTHISKTLSEYGLAVGANYVIGKDLSLFTQYMYGHRHQFGNTALKAGNSQVQVIALGATLKW